MIVGSLPEFRGFGVWGLGSRVGIKRYFKAQRSCHVTTLRPRYILTSRTFHCDSSCCRLMFEDLALLFRVQLTISMRNIILLIG